MTGSVQLKRDTLVDPADATTVEVVVESVDRSCGDVTVVTLARAGGGLLPGWEPGAHIDVAVPDGTMRQYSLCGDPGAETWRLGVLLEATGRGGSRYVREGLIQGEAIRVGLPRNNFALVDKDSFLFFAGGIGVTPLLPMVKQLEARGKAWTLHYGGRSRSTMAFADELLALGPATTIWPDDKGTPIPILKTIQETDAAAAVYCCGPPGLIAAVQGACAVAGREAPYVERFAAVEMPSGIDERSFEVLLNRSGRILQVPQDKSVLEVLEDAGADPGSSCREGICGTCETGVLEGAVDHRDSLLSDEERAQNCCMMVCVSRALSARLTLDL